MPVVTLLRYNLETVVQKVSLRYMLRAVSTANDSLKYDLTVINLIAIGRAAFRTVGARLQIDKGNGTLVPVPMTEAGAEVTLRGSVDGYGIRELTFDWFGRRSPLKTALLRSMARVTMTGIIGMPGLIGQRPMFDGYIRDVS